MGTVTPLCEFYMLTEGEQDCRTMATYPMLVDGAPYVFCREHYEAVLHQQAPIGIPVKVAKRP